MLADLTIRSARASLEPSAFAMLDALRASPIAFHLTGSRFAGTERPDSDWDFLVQDAPGVVAELEQLGFRVLVGEDGDAQYEGKEREPAHTVEIYVHREHPGLQVQLLVDVERGRTVRNTVYDHFGPYDQALRQRAPGVKPSRGDFWREMFDLVARTERDRLALVAAPAAPALVTVPADEEGDDDLPF